MYHSCLIHSSADGHIGCFHVLANINSVVIIHWKDWCWSWNSNTLATWCEELTHWKRPWCWERLKVGGEGDDRGCDGWMASLARWTWVWVGSRNWWWTGKPGMLQSIGLQRVRHDWATEQQMSFHWALGTAPCYIDPLSRWKKKGACLCHILRKHSVSSVEVGPRIRAPGISWITEKPRWLPTKGVLCLLPLGALDQGLNGSKPGSSYLN